MFRLPIPVSSFANKIYNHMKYISPPREEMLLFSDKKHNVYYCENAFSFDETEKLIIDVSVNHSRNLETKLLTTSFYTNARTIDGCKLFTECMHFTPLPAQKNMFFAHYSLLSTKFGLSEIEEYKLTENFDTIVNSFLDAKKSQKK